MHTAKASLAFCSALYLATAVIGKFNRVPKDKQKKEGGERCENYYPTSSLQLIVCSFIKRCENYYATLSLLFFFAVDCVFFNFL